MGNKTESVTEDNITFRL